jgi:hypothetical protein
MRIIVIALLCGVLGGCEAVEERARQRAVAAGQPYRPGFLSSVPVDDAEGMPVRSPRWYNQSGLRVLELPHGWIVRGLDGYDGLTFVPRPQQ